MKSLLPPLICLFVATLVSTLDYLNQKHCCGNESVSMDYLDRCENGQKVELQCQLGFSELAPSYNFQFEMDDDGEFSMTASSKYSGYSFTVYSPHYCVANQTIGGRLFNATVFYCMDKIFYQKEEDSFDYEDFENLLTLTVSMLYLVSSLLLAITAIIYFILPQTQDVEEKCTFHMTLNQSLFCLFTASRILAIHSDIDLTLLEDHCAIQWYLYMFAILGFFTWSALLAYHMWNRLRQNARVNRSTVMYRYLLVGYGIPTLLVALSNIHIHVSSLSRENGLYTGCHRHSSSRYSMIYAGLPIIIIQSACVYFFVSFQRKLWNEQALDSPHHLTSNMKKYQFRFVLNAKLLLITGLPFVLTILFFFCTFLMRSNLFQTITIGIIFLFSIDGIIVFYILVIRRKRVFRGLAEKFGLTAVSGWDACPEEESIEYGNENENQPNREL